MNIYNLKLEDEILDVKREIYGIITIVHPPKNYHYRWYTVKFSDNSKRRVYTWSIPEYFQLTGANYG